MTVRLFQLSAAVLLTAVLLPALARVAHAEEALRAPPLEPAALDLLPLDDGERARFNEQHGVLVYRMQALDKQLSKLRTQLAQRKDKSDADGKRLQVEIRRLGTQVAALMARLTDELRAYGVDGPLVAYMNHAPRGEGRLERYSHGLVLLLPDLTSTQQAMFDRVVAQVEGAYFAIGAQKERTMLALKQSELPKDKLNGLAQTFDRQLQVTDQRFWLLVDYALTRDQKVWIWQRLPQRIKRKSQPVEHMYALPGLEVSQASRLRALMTEIEHEVSPDQAAVRRIAVELRDAKLPADRRKALTEERAAANKRIAELERFRRETVQAILTKDQWLEFLSIPPRISINERGGNFGRDLDGWTPTAAQRKGMAEIDRELADKRKAAARRMADLRREGSDYGADSPQMMSMQMAMAGAKAEGAAAGRDKMAAIFTRVMTPTEVGQWVLGHWGYKR